MHLKGHSSASGHCLFRFSLSCCELFITSGILLLPLTHKKKKTENLIQRTGAPSSRKRLVNSCSTSSNAQREMTSLSSLSLPDKTAVEVIHLIQWNLDLTKCQGTGEIGLLYRGFVISRFFSIHYTTGLKNIVRYTEDFVM